MAVNAAPMASFANTIKRLHETMAGDDADEVACTAAERAAFDHATSAVLDLCTVLGERRDVTQSVGPGNGEPQKPSDAVTAGLGWGEHCTPAGLLNLYQHFTAFDLDGTGMLSYVEIDRMLRQIGIGGEEVRGQVFVDLKRSDDDGEVGTSFDEFVEWLGDTLDKHNSSDYALTLSDDHLAALENLMSSMRKVGFGGTSWRTFQNTIWLLTQAVMIMCGSTIFVGIVWFRFILVPMTMAYFLTYLVGPVIDVMTQRPLICLGHVYCRINKLPPAEAAEEWAKKRTRRPLPHPSELEYPYSSGAGVCCHARPVPRTTNMDVANQVNHTMHQWFTVGKLPFPIALALTIVIIFLFARYTFLFISNDIQNVLQDQKFMDSFEDLLKNAEWRLRTEAGIIVKEFDPYNIRRNLEGNKTCSSDALADDGTVVEGYHAIVTANGTECIQVQEFSSEEFSEMMAPYFAIVNDTVLTLLLCLYLLAARTARGEFDHHRSTHIAGMLTVMEKIEMMNRNYVLLKTKLSALTAGLVMLILGLLSIKLWFIWGVLTFAFNFIPNVGSLIAMVLPVPVILVDEQLGPWVQTAAILLPAIVQAYVGNVLEPQVFGKSLNLTAISVLIGLVFWSAIWGMCGAVLSVPLLGVMKIMLDETDYPLAKRLLGLMREDSTVDEEAMAKAMLRELPGYQQEHAYAVGGKDFDEGDEDTINPAADDSSPVST